MKLLLPVEPIFSNTDSANSIIPIDYHCQPAWKTPRFYSLQHIITIFVGQSAQVYQTIDQNIQQATYDAGKVGIYPAYQSRTIGWDRAAEFIDLYLAPETIARYADPAIDPNRYELSSQFAIDDLLIYSLGIAIKKQATQSIEDRFYIESAIAMLIAHILRNYSIQKDLLSTRSGGLTSAKLNLVLDYIHAHLESNPSLLELATLVNLSSCHFVRVFKESMGIAPHQYLLMCRIEKAKYLLPTFRTSVFTT